MNEGVIILGHGSRRQDANEEIREIYKQLQEKNLQKKYQVGFLDFAKPSLVEAIEELIKKGVKKVIIMPLFLTVGNHMHRGIPEKIRGLETIYPEVKFVLAKHLGPDPRIVNIVEDRIKEAETLF